MARVECFRGFKLDGFQRAVGLDEQVNFIAVAVAPKPKFGPLASMGLLFVKLGEEHIFHNISKKIVGSQLFGGRDAEQMAKQPRIEKVKFGPLSISFCKEKR